MRRRQREVPPDRWDDPGLLDAPKAARTTAYGLWGLVDDEGRMELRPDLIAGYLYPGDPKVTGATIEEHLVSLDDSRFLAIYTALGREWIQLARPLRTPRPMPSKCPPPPPEVSGRFLAVGGAGEGVRERVLRERGERGAAWAEWEGEQERDPEPPRRPILLDAPPIGCPEHPNGRYEDCGPCGTARRRHDTWLAEQVYAERLARFERGADS